MDSTSTTSRQLAFATFDVFTQQRLRGNPLAIVEIPKDCVLDQDIKQAIAKEFNYSETVFLHEAENEGSLDRRIDIFTTLSELAFAGHPTIGTICCIGGNATAGAAHAFNVMTKAGEVQSTYDKSNSRAVASIPHNVHIHSNRLTYAKIKSLFPSPEITPPDDLIELWPRGTQGKRDSDLGFPVVSIVKGMTFILIEFPSIENHLQRLQAHRQLKYAEAVSLDEGWIPSFAAPYFYCLLSQADEQATRIRARMIEPQIGEDPATGSAACTLAAYLALKRGKGGQSYKFDIQQGVEMGRASQIGVEVVLAENGKDVERVLLSGSAVQVMEGTLLI